MRDYIRRVRLTPYRRGMGPVFTLTVWDSGARVLGRDRLSYSLSMKEGHCKSVTLFEGDDFGPSPLHSHDSDDCVYSLLGFLTVRPGDTDPDYFASYSPTQLAYCEQHAEALSLAAEDRFGERYPA